MSGKNNHSIAGIILSIGPAAVVIAMLMGPGSISSLVIAGSELGYSAVWVPIVTGWLAAAVYYTGGKSRVVTKQTPVEMISEYTHPLATYALLILMLVAVYFVVIATGFLLAGTSSVLLGMIGLGQFLEIALVVQLLAIIGIVLGGFTVAKVALSVLVIFLAAAYLLNTLYINPDVSNVATGVIPTSVPPGLGQLGFAGIVGGSIGTGPIWYAYLVDDNDWSVDNLRSMAWDQVIFLGIVFTLFSVAIYVSAAATLQGVTVGNSIDAAISLEPIAGELAALIFTVGLWGATITSLGAIPALAAYVIGDIINDVDLVDTTVELSIDDRTIKGLTVLGILTGSAGLLLDGPPLQLIAFGLTMFTLVAPIIIVLFAIPLLDGSIGGEHTGPWYVIAGLAIAFLVALYSAYMTVVEVAVVAAILSVAILLRHWYVNRSGDIREGDERTA